MPSERAKLWAASHRRLHVVQIRLFGTESEAGRFAPRCRATEHGASTSGALWASVSALRLTAIVSARVCFVMGNLGNYQSNCSSYSLLIVTVRNVHERRRKAPRPLAPSTRHAR